MLNFNLLPPQGKQEIQMEEISFGINRFLQGVLILLMILFVLTLTIYLYLDILVKSQEEMIQLQKESPIYKEVLTLEKKIDEANSKIKRIYNKQQEIKYFSPILAKIASLISNVKGTFLYNLSFTRKIEKTVIESPQIKEQKEPQEETQEEPQRVVEKEIRKVDILGFAPKREQVLQIEEALEKESEFSNLVSPIENIISPTDINFSFTFEIK